jgi:phosphatidylglycerophosphate synthase
VRNRLIESRLTPNAISLTGLALNVLAAVLVWERYFFLGGLAFIVGSILDTLDGRYSRMSDKGTPFGAFLDSTLDRCEEGIVLTAVAANFAREHNQIAVAAVVAPRHSASSARSAWPPARCASRSSRSASSSPAAHRSGTSRRSRRRSMSSPR